MSEYLMGGEGKRHGSGQRKRTADETGMYSYFPRGLTPLTFALSDGFGSAH